jgi:Gram-negative porin
MGEQMKLIKFNRIIMSVVMLAAAGAHADDKFTVNGYGYQDYRQTNGNFSSGASQRGTWDNNYFALVMSAKFTDRDTAWAQLQANSTEPTRFTWMFVDHRFTDNLSVHVGRVKFPYGIYNEFIDNKWLQLSAVLPSAYNFSGADMGYDAYSGAGVDWTTGSLFTQVYGGNNFSPDQTSDDHADRRLIGFRVTWNTPHDGLRFLVSANEAQIEANALNSDVLASNTPPLTGFPTLTQLGREDRAMLSVDYVSDRFDIKSEYNYHKVPFLPLDAPPAPGFDHTNIANAWYIQGGYKMGSWTPYARYDSYQADQRNTSDPSLYQKDWVIGVNYKINGNVNARIEDHVIRGYGLPAGADEVAAGSGQTSWNLIAAEVNFLF